MQHDLKVGDFIQVGKSTYPAFTGTIVKIGPNGLHNREQAAVVWLEGIPTWEPLSILHRVPPLIALAMMAE